jgi:hypothetical protein
MLDLILYPRPQKVLKLAGAYDKLASSLTKFGGALQSIDGR